MISIILNSIGSSWCRVTEELSEHIVIERSDIFD